MSRWLLAVRREGNFILISGCGEEAQDTMVGCDFMENMNFSKGPIWSKICPMLQKKYKMAEKSQDLSCTVKIF